MVVTLVFSSHSGDPRINIFFTDVVLEPATDTAVSVAGSSTTSVKIGLYFKVPLSGIPIFLETFPIFCHRFEEANFKFLEGICSAFLSVVVQMPSEFLDI